MTKKTKRQHIATPTTTTTTTRQRLPLSNTYRESPSCGKGKRNARVTDIPSNSDHGFGVYASMNGDKKRIKRYANEILQHKRSTIELKPDGSIVITPHPRPGLPNEILSLIFSHLSANQASLYQSTLVTKQFYAMANPLLWKVVDTIYNYRRSQRFMAFIRGPTLQPQQHQKQRLKTLGQYIRRLDCGNLWGDTQLEFLLPYLTHLEHLSFVNASAMTDHIFHCVPLPWQHLTSLKLHGARLTQLSFSAIGQHAHRLDDFEWIPVIYQSLEWLALLAPCPLKRLRLIAGGASPTDEGITAIQALDGLTCLEIIGTAHPSSMRSLFMAASNPATTVWPRLTTLSIGNCAGIDDTTMTGFIKSHPYLQQLDLMCARLLSCASLDAMVKYLPDLTRLTLDSYDHINHGDIRRLITQLWSIEYVNLSNRLILDYEFPERHDGKNDSDEDDDDDDYYGYDDFDVKYMTGVVLDATTIDKIRDSGME